MISSTRPRKKSLTRKSSRTVKKEKKDRNHRTIARRTGQRTKTDTPHFLSFMAMIRCYGTSGQQGTPLGYRVRNGFCRGQTVGSVHVQEPERQGIVWMRDEFYDLTIQHLDFALLALPPLHNNNNNNRHTHIPLFCITLFFSFSLVFFCTYSRFRQRQTPSPCHIINEDHLHQLSLDTQELFVYFIYLERKKKEVYDCVWHFCIQEATVLAHF